MDFALGNSRRGLPQVLLDLCKLAVASELEAGCSKSPYLRLFILHIYLGVNAPSVTPDDAWHFNDTFTYFHSFHAHNGSSMGVFRERGNHHAECSFIHLYLHSFSI